MRPTTTIVLCAVALAGAAAVPADAQTPQDTGKKSVLVSVVPGARYEAGSFKRAIFGGGWRDVWTTPVAAPVLDIDTYAGGLKLNERGGGFHSLVIHLDEEKGWREYRFRSVDKFPMQGMPKAVHGTVVGNVFQDQVSIFFPAAPIIVPPLLEAVGLLHVKPELYVMGDSPRLEYVRDTVAGMLGTFELKGEEAPDDKPGFAGSTSIKSTEKFYEDLAEGREHRVDEKEFLAARLIDILINDPDRSPDNYDWARFGEKGAYTWRPLPRDRDQAFMDARGLINALVLRRFYPKQVQFGPRIDLKGLTYTTHVLDRRLLQRLTAEDFRDVALRVQTALTDEVIARSVGSMPVEWRTGTNADEQISSWLRARRDALPAVAATYYRKLASEVDIHGTDTADRVDVLRHADGRVTVTITDPERVRVIAEERQPGRIITSSDGTVAGPNDRGPYFTRTFIPGETKEIRIYADSGDDVAVISGAAVGPIKVRLVGGKGDDLLADSAGGGDSYLYDAEGTNRLHATNDTRVNTRPWKEVKSLTGFRVGGDWRPDWGRSRGWRPALDYNTGAGFIIGAGPRFRSYGFRRLPYKWEVGSQLLVGTGNGRLGFALDADYRAENSPRAYELSLMATQLEATRFFGYGNDTPDASRTLSLVDQNMISVEPSLVWHLGWRAREGMGNPIRGEDTMPARLRPTIGEFRVGPTFAWIDPDPVPGSPMALSGAQGTQSFGVGGAAIGLELDRTDDDAVPTAGFKLAADLAAYPALMGAGVHDAFGTASAGGSLYLPLMRVGAGPHLALRAGASMATGGYPPQFAAAIGGRNTVRGYSWRRFAGDAATSGSAELRVPVGTINLFLRSQLGVFALADAGRVWFDGRSDGNWHTGVGGGIWLAALGRSLSIAYARGESPRFYLNSGLFF